MSEEGPDDLGDIDEALKDLEEAAADLEELADLGEDADGPAQEAGEEKEEGMTSEEEAHKEKGEQDAEAEGEGGADEAEGAATSPGRKRALDVDGEGSDDGSPPVLRTVKDEPAEGEDAADDKKRKDKKEKKDKKDKKDKKEKKSKKKSKRDDGMITDVYAHLGSPAKKEKHEGHEGEVKLEEMDIENAIKEEIGSDVEMPVSEKAESEEEYADENEAWQATVAKHREAFKDQYDDLFEKLEEVHDQEKRREHDKQPATKDLVDRITLKRSRDLIPHLHLPFFVQLVKGAFVRASIKSENTSETRGPVKYALFEVLNAVPSGVDPVTGAARKYKVSGGGQTVETDWLLMVKSGRHVRKMPITNVSNEEATEDEYVNYVLRMERHKELMMSRKRAIQKRAEIWDTYNKFYKGSLSEADVEKIVETRARLRGRASVNLVRNKMVILQELEALAQLQLEAEEDNAELPEEYRKYESTEEGWLRFYEDTAKKKRELEDELRETQEKLMSVLCGQNSSFETLAMLTHRNAAGNKGRLEAEDPVDAIVFGRKQGRSGKSYWSVSEGGFEVKKKEITEFWETKDHKEQAEKDRLQARRIEERRMGTRPIKDLTSFMEKVVQSVSTEVEMGDAPFSQTSTSSGDAPARKKARIVDDRSSPTPSAPKRRTIDIASFLASQG